MFSKPLVSVALGTGEILTRKAAVASPSWQDRTLDLRKAYKQMAVAASDRHLMVLTHESPNGRLFYISDALPFGARGSVFSFLRTSRALSFLMNVGVMIPGAVFFDDFPSITETSSAGSAFDGPRALLDTLGWLCAEDTDKCKLFGSCVLGCRLDLTHLTSGNLVLANRDGRLESIQSMVEKMKSERNPGSLIPVVQGHFEFRLGIRHGTGTSTSSPILVVEAGSEPVRRAMWLHLGRAGRVQTPVAVLALAASSHPLINRCCLRRRHRGDRNRACGHPGWQA